MWRKRIRRRLPALLGSLAVALLISAAGLADLFAWRTARDLVFDSYQRAVPRPRSDDLPVRVVTIDDASLRMVGQWPWPRQTVARLITELQGAGAAAIGLDVVFSEADGRSGSAIGAGLTEGDAAMRDAIAAGRVVLGQALIDKGGPAITKAGVAFGGDNPSLFLPRFGGSLTPLAPLAEAAAGVGALNWVPDRDLVVRRIPLLFNVGGSPTPGFSTEMLRVAQGAGSVFVKSSNASGERVALERQTGIVAMRIGQVTTATEADGSVRIRFSGSQATRHISAADILAGNFARSRIEGTMVLIGATAIGLSDIRATPLEPAVPGIDIHAELLEHLLLGESLARPDYARGMEAVLTVAAALVAAAIVAIASPVLAGLICLLLAVAIGGGSFLGFLREGVLFDPIGPILAVGSSFAVGATSALRRSRREQQEIRDAFSRYVSPDVVAALQADPSKLSLGGELRDITVLFSDIRGFTTRSEAMPARDVVTFLNEIHTPLTEAVLASGGTLDKFIGDGMMAFWNAPLDVPDHVHRALACAIRMQELTQALDARLQREAEARGTPHLPIAIGLGVHTGQACIGNLGSSKRFDYSAVGDTVNTAARIEQSCKTYGASMLVSSVVADLAPDFAIFPIDVINLKGKTSGTRLCILHGEPSANDKTFAAFRQRMSALVDRFAAGQATPSGEIEALAQHPIGRIYPALFALYRARNAELASPETAER